MHILPVSLKLARIEIGCDVLRTLNFVFVGRVRTKQARVCKMHVTSYLTKHVFLLRIDA